MTGDAVVRGVGPPKVLWWQVLRVALVVGWVVWAGVTWWATPRESSVEQARADLVAGRVTYHEWGDGWQRDNGLVSPFPAGLESSSGVDSLLLWHTSDGRQHYAALDVPDLADGENVPPPGGEADALHQALTAGESRRPADPPLNTIRAGLLIAGIALILWALLSAPDPVTGTKWFWFWLVSGVPLGLGLLWWLARERPWRPRTPPRFGPPGRDNRLKWWAGIGVAILTGFGVSLALIGLHSLFGDALVAQRP